MDSEDTLLRRALLANAVFSGLSALSIAAAAGPVGRLLGSVSPVTLYIIAGALALFAFDLLQQARSEELSRGRALGAAISDLVWVVGSGILLLIGPEALSETGLLLVAAVALIVLVFAALQLIGLRTRRSLET
jgi:hypothetical protein